MQNYANLTENKSNLVGLHVPKPKRDCVKTIFNFRKLLSLCQCSKPSGRILTYKAQFLKLNEFSHTLKRVQIQHLWQRIPETERSFLGNMS
jgi:hypothetical protein